MGMIHLFKGIKRSQKQPDSAIAYLVVGLGNPGKQYEQTRHNAGFMAMDVIAAQWGVTLQRRRFQAMCASAVIGGHKCLLMKPVTYMNLSGQSVLETMQFYKIPPEQVILLFDDISLDIGKLRIRRKGTHGGQNGIKHIIQLSGSDAFPRIKIGVGGKPHADYDLAKWVLSRFSQQEIKDLAPALKQSAHAVECIIQGNIDQAMNQFN